MAVVSDSKLSWFFWGHISASPSVNNRGIFAEGDVEIEDTGKQN